MRTDQIASADFIGGGLDNGNTVGIEVAHHELAAVGLESEAHRGLSYVEQREQLIVLKINRSHLCRTSASHKSLAAVRQDGNVLWLMANWDCGSYQ